MTAEPIAKEPSVSRPLVWVVDDSPLDADRAHRALAATCDVRVFTDGSAALEQLAAGAPPDVLILDWVMPGVTGIEVVQFLRSERGRMPQVPVLLLTSQQKPEQIVEGLSAGANDYLAKPFAPEELTARVDALVRSARLLGRVVTAERVVRDLLANAPDALLVVDDLLRVSYANGEAGHLFRMSTEELAAHSVHDLIPELQLPQGRGQIGPLADVKIYDALISPTIRSVPSENATMTIISLRDVTDRRLLEERRLDLYSIVAHDLRSPLGAMMLRTDLLLEGGRGPLAPAVSGELNRFRASMQSMIAMINDFLDLARLDAAPSAPKHDAVDLCALIDETVEELRPLAEAGRLVIDHPDNTCRSQVLGDRMRLAQVLSNLIGNAIKFTPAGGKVTITAAERGATVEARVSDTGPGIPAEAVGTVFERFTRVGGERPTPGTGLGLMIVRQVVEAHGGSVGVESTEGRGSTFWFRLPRHVDATA